MFAQIAVNIRNNDLDRLFTYRIPQELLAEVKEGSLVSVPFGGKKVLGIVTSLATTADQGVKVKDISEVVHSDLLNNELLALAKFISGRYIASFPTVLFAMAGFGAQIKKPERLKRLPVKETILSTWPELMPSQKEVLDTILKDESGRFLLHGVTGSGKTEVYLHLFNNAFNNGKQALLLVPEIALTPQLTGIFSQRFGARVQILHSKLSAGERMLVWLKAMKGEIDGIIGARSAVFAPFSRLGVIIMDEEHEYSFKQESIPRFHTRLVAAWRANYHKCRLIYGSATPALESYFAALTKKLVLLNMPERIADRPLPKVEIIDLREEIKAGNRTVFSRSLQEKIRIRLEKGEQSILFLNRRGYSAFVGCRDCGEIMFCPQCSVTLTYHRGMGALRCHYCEHTATVPLKCSQCGSANFRRFGVGTERIEEEIKQLFPSARVVRMDVDTTTRKEAHSEIYSALKKGEADILIGTQMVAKGLDLPKVTLVGVIDADISLFMPDFRAREKTFQLLTQVAGRAGRADLPGEVVFQTFYPQDFTLLTAAKQDYRTFCEHELYKRKILEYPPFTNMVRFVISGEDEVAVANTAQDLVNLFNKTLSPETKILGPAPAPVSKLRGKYRWHIHLKSKALQKQLAVLKKTVYDIAAKYKKENVIIHIDVDPYNAL